MRSPQAGPDVVSVDISDGIHQQWAPDRAADVFRHYDPSWKLPVATRGNGKAWLLNPELTCSDIDLRNHEDWIYDLIRTPDGGVYIDVGGYVGSHAIHIAAGCHAKVLVIEPVPLHQEMIRRNAILNGVKLSVVPCAAGAQPGIIYLDRIATCSHATAEAIRASVRPIDSICAEMSRIDVVKIDVEGAECEVIAGGMETINRLRPKLVIEVHGTLPGREENGSTIARQLDELKYHYTHVWSNVPGFFYVIAEPD